MPIPTEEELGFLELLTMPRCKIQTVGIPEKVGRRMTRYGWVEWNPPIAGPALYSLTNEGLQALHAAKALEGGR